MAFPERVAIEVRGASAEVLIGGETRTVDLPESNVSTHLQLDQPGPAEREYQIDGSDTTSTNDRDPDVFLAIRGAPWYRLMAWLRDEGSYSRWEDIQLIDLADGQVLASGLEPVESAPLPAAFRVEAILRRPEAPVSIWIDAQDGTQLAGLTLDRHEHKALWAVGKHDTDPTTWYFPNNLWPFASELMQLAGRSLAAAIALLLAAACLGWMCARLLARVRLSRSATRAVPPAPVAAALVLIVWLTAALWVAVRVYHQLPHIVDAQAYYFQARIFETGRTWLAMPDIVSLLDGFQQVEWNGRWFAQYPPGAPALYALGDLVGLAWLVGPLATLVILIATAVGGLLMFDRWVAMTALVLLALSPFVLFQSGSFMSHPIAGAACASALAAFAYSLRRPGRVVFICIGVLLGMGFVTREVTGVLYGLVFGVWLLAMRRWRGLAWSAAAIVPFVAIYLLFNLSTTDHLLRLPRTLFNPDDRWGFGSVGPLGQHTVAGGLVNTDENLTLLQFDLFGWPPLAAFALIAMPFLFGRTHRFDWLLAACAGSFVVAYVGYFYQGIALGPRYYFEAVPPLALLAARGLQTCVRTLRGLGLEARAARFGTGLVLGILCAWTLGYYLPHEMHRRMDFGTSSGRHLVMPFVESTLGGARLTQVEAPALIAVPNEDVFKSLSALNCPLLEEAHLDECPVLLVNGDLSEIEPLYSRFPNRAVWLVTSQGDVATLQRVRDTT